MKKGLKVFLIILAAVLVLGGGVAVWQWDNITSVMYFMKYSKEDLENLNIANKEILDDVAAQLEVTPRELTEDENMALEAGIITEQEAVEISLGKTTLPELEKNNAQKNNEDTKAPQQIDRVSELVAKLYVLKSSFVSKLDALAAQAIAEYSATPEAQRTAAWKASKMAKFTGLASGLEASCDAQVEGVISELRAELKRTGGDSTIISTIRSAYESEKQIKKAYYLNKYLK